MFNDIHKDCKQELSAIKHGIRFDFNFLERFKRDDFENLDLINLKNYVQKCLIESIDKEIKNETPENAERIRTECLNNDKLYCELKLARIKGTKNYFIPVYLSIISLFFSLIIFIINISDSISSAYFSAMLTLSDPTANDIVKILDGKTDYLGKEIGVIVIIFFITFIIGLTVNTIIETKKQDKTFFYEFMKNCILEIG